MAQRDLDACLIAAPENIYYLTGLDHQGYFACHMLVVPRADEACLIAREMERPTVEAQVAGTAFVGYSDSADPATVTCDVLVERGLARGRLGLEMDTLFLPPRIANAMITRLSSAHWLDATGIVDELRLIKSARELSYTRQAAAVTDAMLQAARAAAAPGATERHVAAEVHRAMIEAGGEYPGFAPFIRSTPRLDQEHVTWSDRTLAPGDLLFVELAGCVRRYHAPAGRLVFLGELLPESDEIAEVCRDALERVVDAMAPGAVAGDVYAAWQSRVDEAGLAHYRRHHCGYTLGIGFPPSWVGGSRVVGLRHDSHMQLRAGMVFHVMSWLMGTHRGDYFISDTAVVTETGAEVLTSVPRRPHVV
jgi:Xaa-Pro dipeptidase